MAKWKFNLTEAEQKDLQKAYQASKDADTRTRYPAVRLHGEGYAEKEIERITGCSRTSEFDGVVSNIPSRSFARIG